jgi:hypothetical protein
LTPWTHEYFANPTVILYLLSSTYVKSLAFCFFCSNNEDPERDAAAAPSAETMAADEPSLQEVAPVVKSSKAPIKKVTSTRGFKRARKSTDAGASLDAHRSTSSSEDVRNAPDIFPLFFIS